MTVCSFFRSWARLGGSSVLKEVSSEIIVFGGRGVQEPRRKVVPKGVQKQTPKKTQKLQFWGVCFGSLGNLLDDSWAYLGALCCCLAASWPQGPKKRGREPPKGSQETPEDAKTAPGEPKRGPGEPKRGPREPKTGPREPQERPRLADFGTCF